MEDCPLDATCALELVNGMKKAQSDIETLTEKQEEILKKIDDIHKFFIMLGGFKRGLIAAFVLFSGIYLFYTGKISLKDLLNWLL
jgi:hypothetical protein